MFGSGYFRCETSGQLSHNGGGCLFFSCPILWGGFSFRKFFLFTWGLVVSGTPLPIPLHPWGRPLNICFSGPHKYYTSPAEPCFRLLHVNRVHSYTRKLFLKWAGPPFRASEILEYSGSGRVYNATVCNYKAATLKDDGLCCVMPFFSWDPCPS